MLDNRQDLDVLTIKQSRNIYYETIPNYLVNLSFENGDYTYRIRDL